MTLSKVSITCDDTWSRAFKAFSIAALRPVAELVTCGICAPSLNVFCDSLWSNGVATTRQAAEMAVASRILKELGFIVADCDAPEAIDRGERL